MRILGIESSCDETAAAVVQDGRQVLSNVIATSLEEHKLYGGVVPEIASRLILTTNQDTQFVKLYPEEKVAEIQGDHRFL